VDCDIRQCNEERGIGGLRWPAGGKGRLEPDCGVVAEEAVRHGPNDNPEGRGISVKILKPLRRLGNARVVGPADLAVAGEGKAKKLRTARAELAMECLAGTARG
jgi:hypothetical protein